MKKSLGEIENEINEDFCNVKTLKEKAGDDDESGRRMWQGLMCL